MKNTVRTLRLQHDLTQRELANACNVSRSTIAEIEAGRPPKGEVMLRIANFFTTDPREIFFENTVLSTVQELREKRSTKMRGAKVFTRSGQ